VAPAKKVATAKRLATDAKKTEAKEPKFVAHSTSLKYGR
jgi:hypothetical protein